VRAEGLRPAAFLDRDGTLNVELERPIRSPEDLTWIPGALEGAARLHRAGFALVVVTNQSAIARGALAFDDLARVHAELRRALEASGAPLAAIEVCPHHPSEGDPPYRRACACRKPGSALIDRAALALGLDLAASWTLGDACRDLAAGARAGTRTALVATGKGERERERLAAELGAERARSVIVARDLAAAADEIVRAAAQGR
jgi:D-glycero-D-manno-heptose 1,7-bisphosphate phosphatase